MTYEDLIVLIPSHSLEDFPAELAENEAASLLNSFAVAWHPALLASAKTLPRWHRADDPPDATQRRLILVPANCESWIPPGWAERVTSEGCTVVRGISERQAMIDAALAPLESGGCDPEVAADFLALGFCYLQIELLTRKMRHFSNLDEVHLQREAVAAAEAALAGDLDTVRTRLKSCFEVLTESRERFYPVDCYLLDLCLLIPRLADDHLLQMLRTLKPVSVLASAHDFAEICRTSPEAQALLKEGWERGSADIVCGDLSELPLPLMPPNSVVWQLREAQQTVADSLGKRPIVWGRRRYGVFPQLPQILKKTGFQGSLHAVLDDGIYPDAEHSKLRWEGTDGTSIDTLSRIPLAADAATSFLRFPDRMSESMDNDHVAAVIFARWPEVKAPFHEDLRRMAQYAPVLGRFVTLTDFFSHTDNPTRHAQYRPNEYLTPYLFQAVAREEADAVSRHVARAERRVQLDSGAWLAGMNRLLRGLAPDQSGASLEREIESLPEPATAEAAKDGDAKLAAYVGDSAKGLADLILHAAGDRPGYLIFNSLGFRRMVTVSLDRGGLRPQAMTDRAWVQWDESHGAFTVDVPGSGFVWIPAAENDTPDSVQSPPLVEENRLRNEFFEVHLNDVTGGIARIKGYGRAPNRLSQQLNFRFSRERSIPDTSGEGLDDLKSQYAEMRRVSSRVTCTGPALGEIITEGEIVDQLGGQRLAGFTQTVRVWRGRPVVEVDVELTVDRMPDAEPWHSFFASRFAWHDETASITRGVMLGAHEVAEERFEGPGYIELATPETRTTIVTHGLPFHRKTGQRMIDTILIVPGETRRRFRFTIAVDQNFPQQAAFDAQIPAIVVPTRKGPPKSGTTGWFFHLDARNVQMLGLFPLMAEPQPVEESWQTERPQPELPTGSGCGVRLFETEGNPVRVRLRCFRTPRSARQRDFNGHTMHALSIDSDAVLVDLTPHEIADVEIHFD